MSALTITQSASNSAAAATVTTTYLSVPKQDALMVAIVENNGVTVPTITNWTQDATQAFGLGIDSSLTMFHKIAGASEATGIVANATAATTMSLHIVELANNETESAIVFDAKAGATSGSGVNVTTLAIGPTPTTLFSDEISIAAIGLRNTGSNPVWTNSYTILQTTSQLFTATLALSGRVTTSTTPTWTSARNAGGLICTYKALLALPAWFVAISQPYPDRPEIVSY